MTSAGTEASDGRSAKRPLTRPMRLFLAASLQSSLGNEMAYVAVLLLAYTQSPTSWAITAVLLAELVPTLLLANAAGALADRLSRRTLVVSADLARVVIFAALAVSPSIGVTLTLATLASVSQTVFRPASRSAIPSLTDRDGLGRAMGTLAFVGRVAQTAGPLVAAIILLAGGPAAVMLVNAATFLVSAAVLSRLPLDAAPTDQLELATSEPAPTVPGGARGTLRLIRTLETVPAVFIAGFGATFAFAMINVAEPLLVRETLAAGESTFALLIAVFGGGATVGAALARTQLRLLFLAGGGSVAAVGLTAFATTVPMTGVLFALSGLFAGLFMASEDRLLATMVPQHIQGRVYGLKDSMDSGACIGAYVIAGAVAGAAGPRAVFAVSAATALLAGLAALRFAARPTSRRGRAVPQPCATP